MYHDFINDTDLWYEFVNVALNNTLNPKQTEKYVTTVRTNNTGGAKNITLKMLALCTDDPNYKAFATNYKVELLFFVASFILLFVRR
jgi:hypothetical protein